jgi:hypothetical protein
VPHIKLIMVNRRSGCGPAASGRRRDRVSRRTVDSPSRTNAGTPEPTCPAPRNRRNDAAGGPTHNSRRRFGFVLAVSALNAMLVNVIPIRVRPRPITHEQILLDRFPTMHTHRHQRSLIAAGRTKGSSSPYTGSADLPPPPPPLPPFGSSGTGAWSRTIRSICNCAQRISAPT